ncbi:hypothetical protein JX266_007118 [Neoarthrinium moseri]|nr:hypothetical protein JX266_007118 [Neoarthrinium moseri]
METTMETDASSSKGQDAPKTQPEKLEGEEVPPTASPAPSSTSSLSRPHYAPQFSATTEMILKRIRGEPNNLSSAISSASAAGAIKQSAYEDTKRRLVMSMNTSLTLPMPASIPVPALAPSRMMPKKEGSQAGALPSLKPRGRPTKLDKKGKAPRGAKRKRGKDEDDASSVLSDPSESDEDEDYQNTATPTMTKSGRQILKPTQFNPATGSGAGKKKHYGKRTPEQALCKVCTRGLSPTSNQVVFCDGCNFCWHQLCHDPYIDDEFVSDETRSWFCRNCLAKRERHLAKKKSMDGFKGVSWSTKSADQRRTYLSGLPQGQLVNLIMYSLELHPDLPLFPEGSGARRGRPPAVQPTAVRIAVESNGPVNFSKLSTPDTPLKPQADREGSEESVPPAWPKAGSGVLAKLALNEDDFQDKNDFESFSVATYEAGKKIMENGMPVSSQETADRSSGLA